MKAIRILTLITALFSGVPALAADSAQATPAVSLTGEKAVAQLKESGQYDSIAAAYEAARHAVRADEAEPDGVLHAQNPGHGLSASFDRHGLQLSVQRHGAEGERLTTRWRLDSVGRDGTVEKVPAGDALRRDGQRAEIVRAGLGLTEWFVNRPSGLEHGFTLDRRPAGEGALRLDIAIEGDLSPVPGADGQRIELHDAAGAKVLDYDKLRVWDAAGQELPARMEQAAAGGLRFRVEDAGARYPLTVDPTFNQQAYLKASNAGASDGFGWSVSVSGDTVVVGAPNEDGDAASTTATPNESAADAGAAYVFVRSGSTWTQQGYLKASNAGAGDGFGFTVAVSGDTVVVGAWSEDSSTTGTTSTPNEGAAQAGAAYVFVRSGSTWTQQAYLKASNTAASDEFGRGVAVSGDTVIVGAENEAGDAASTVASSNNNAAQAGAAYVFTRSGSTWSQQAYLKASNAGAGDKFYNVAIAGNTVAVGASYERGDAASTAAIPNDNASAAGAAYVFTRSGSTWTQQAYLKASNAGAGDRFGESVAVSVDTLAVGAHFEAGDAASTAAIPNNNAGGAGAAYVFTRSGSTWTQQAYLKASNAGASDKFGRSVEVSGDTVIAGADSEDSSNTGINGTPNESAGDAGAAYMFVRSGSTWTQQSYIKARNAQAADYFGFDVAVSGGTVVVGADSEDSSTTGINTTPNESAADSGAAYVFALIPNPTLTSVSQPSGPIAGGTTVTLTGTGFTGFTGTPTVTFRGIAATAVTVVNATTITCTTPAATAGTASVLVTTPGGSNAANTLFTYGAPPSPPTLTSLTPATGTTAGGTTVTLTGTNFTGATGVTFGGTAATILTVNATTITCTTPARAAGAVNVLVTTPGGTSVASSQFTYAAPPPLPTLTSLTPATGPTAGGTIVTLTGTNFTGATGVTFGGTAVTALNVVNATTITCTTAARAAGAVSVLVTTPGGSNAANTLFTYVAPPSPPTLTSVTPNSGTTAGGTVVTLTGTNFTGATNVTFGGTAATSLTVNSATTITCTTPAGTAGAKSVLVTTPGGTNAANTLFTYVVPPSPPTLTSLTPNSGSTAGGLLVTLTGTNFTGATGVTFGGTAATNRTVVNATTITCTTPARAAGTASVLVTTPGGTNAANTLFTYVAPPSPPSLTSVSPNSGSTAGGTMVTLTGTNFTGATNVTFGGTAATNRTVVNATTITCTTPARAAGTASVLVTTPGGTNAANTLFTYVPQQIIGTLNIYWVGLAGPSAGCGAIETTDGTPADAADGNITMSGVSVSDPCISTATYTFTVSPDGLTLTGADTLSNVPMVLTRTPDQSFFSGLWELGGERFRAYISAAPFTATLTTAVYTGSNPTLNGGALYGFPIVSDTKTLPATLTVTSTSAGTLLSGSSPGMNTGFRTNINMTPPAGQFQVIQTISLALPGAFDDGLRLDYNGQTVLDFDFSNYTNIPAVNSMFGGGWTPWTGEGAPVVLELDASGLRLMVTATSNGTGAAAGVLTGQRVNVLNYFTSDTYVPDPADPDFVSGVQIGLYNRNAGGAWAIPNVALTATARVIPRHTAQITRAPGGNPALLFKGMASQSYLIQRSTNLLNWSTIHTASAAANGTLSYTDTTPPAGRAYYRIALP